MLTYLSGIGAKRPNRQVSKQAKKTAVVQAKQAKQAQQSALKQAKQAQKTALVQAKQAQKTAAVKAKQAQKTALVTAKIERNALQQQGRQQRLTSAAQFVAPAVKKVVRATPASLVVQRIKKAKVEGQKRAAFKNAGEPLAISPEEIFAEPEEIQNADIEFEAGAEEIDEPEFENYDMEEELGIIYPGYAGVKKTSKKKAPVKKAPVKNPAAKAKRQEALKKVSAGVLNVAKATLEAKGIKFPTKEQVEKEAEVIAPAASPKKSNNMLYIIGGGALLALLIFKKK